MRTLILALLMAVPASAAERLTVATPMTSVVTNAQRLRDVCTSDADFDACTRFIAFRLTASCVPIGSQYTIEATATFKPWIFLYNLHSLPHEQLHIGDIRSYTERYLDSLANEPFSTREACEAVALAAQASFEEKMHEFARRSNEERHRAILTARHVYSAP